MTTHAVTGATSFTGRFIAQRLVAAGHEVRNLTRGVLADPARLHAALDGSDTLYNTLWIRFERGPITYAWATERSRMLFEAARRAGVRRIVHISVTNASSSSPLPYFRGKGLTEESVVRSGLSHAILRPSLVFGREDILVNNIAWILRRVPIFGVPGSGDYRVQPVSVEDVADLAVSAAVRTDNIVQDAVGPEVFSFRELIRMISTAIGGRARIISVPPAVGMLAVALIGRLVDDVVLTAEELQGLTANLLVSSGPSTGRRQFSDWLAEHAGSLGLHYAHELNRHYRSVAR